MRNIQAVCQILYLYQLFLQSILRTLYNVLINAFVPSNIYDLRPISAGTDHKLIFKGDIYFTIFCNRSILRPRRLQIIATG